MRRKWAYRWLRHPRTTQERRRNKIREEWEYYRAARWNLPEAYDDIFRVMANNFESWKRLRVTQYRVKEMKNGGSP